MEISIHNRQLMFNEAVSRAPDGLPLGADALHRVGVRRRRSGSTRAAGRRGSLVHQLDQPVQRGAPVGQASRLAAIAGVTFGCCGPSAPPRWGGTSRTSGSTGSCGRAVFAQILDLADRKGMSIRWGIRGFTMGVDIDGARELEQTGLFRSTGKGLGVWTMR